MNSVSVPGPSPPIIASPHYKWWAYGAVGTGLLVTVMDQSGVNIALPSIADDFVLDIPTVQWILLTYVLTTSIMFMPVGRLADIIGRKNVYLLGLSVYIVGAAVGGAAQAFPMLIASKVIQGIGAAGIQANGLAIITASFPEGERGKAVGLYTTIIGTGLISGPIFGGLLVSGLGWRSVFFANVPSGLLAMLCALVVLKGEAPLRLPGIERLRFDWGGAGLSSGALVGFLLGMTNGHRFGWGSAPVASSFAVAGVLLMVFIWWQLRASDPMLDLRFFRSKVFSMGVSARFLNFLASSSVFFLMPFYLINGLGHSPGKAGLMLVPSAVCMAVTGPISGRLSDKVGTRWTTSIGQALSASAMFIFSRLAIESSTTHVITGLALYGLGLGTFNAANTGAVLRSQGQERFGIIAAFLNVVRTAGNVTGIALATIIVTVTMSSLGYEPSLASLADAGSEGIRVAFVSGLNRAFLAAGSMMLLAMVVSALHGTARREPSRSREGLDTQPPGPSS